MKKLVMATGLAGLAVLAGCATARSYLALRQVQFHVDRAAGIRVAGISLDRVRSYTDLNALDGARLAAAVLRGVIPLEFDLHVTGANPAENATTARMIRMQWTLLLNGTQTVSGTVDTAYTFAPGGVTDMSIPINLDLVTFFRTNARDAIDLALGLSGASTRPTQIALTAIPTIDTPIGPITYPNPITIVRRTVGGP